MFYYQRQIGDYAAATRHLSLLEHGVYALMLDAYYLNESPLPADMNKLCRLLGARSQDEREAVEIIAAEFFVLDGENLRQTRCDAEISKIQAKSEKAKASAKARWGKASDDSEQDDDASGMRTHSERNANGMLSKTQDPRPKKEHMSSEDDAKPKAGLQEVLDIYHDLLPELPAVKIINKKRQAALSARQREYPKASNLDWWRTFFARASDSSFLMGTGNNARSWRADFDFLLSPKGFIGIIEGKYE